MVESKVKQFKDRIRKLSPNQVVEIIEKESINYADIFALKLQDEKVLEKWLYQNKVVNLYTLTYVRDEKDGRMKAKQVKNSKVRPTSNGQQQIMYMIDLAKRYDSRSLMDIVDKAIKMTISKAAAGEAYYYVENPESEGKKKVMELDFDELASKYLKLPREMQSKDAILAFFESDEITENLVDSGYALAKLLMTEFDKKLTPRDIKKLVNYINSRLVRMEEKIIAIGDKGITNQADSLIEKLNKGEAVHEWELDRVINNLKKCNSDVRHALKAKYNRELSRYFRLLKPIYDKHELDANDKNHELAELYVDLTKTYDIINDDYYVEMSRKHDRQIAELEKHMKAGNYQKAQPFKKSKFNIVEILDKMPVVSGGRGVADRDDDDVM